MDIESDGLLVYMYTCNAAKEHGMIPTLSLSLTATIPYTTQTTKSQHRRTTASSARSTTYTPRTTRNPPPTLPIYPRPCYARFGGRSQRRWIGPRRSKID